MYVRAGLETIDIPKKEEEKELCESRVNDLSIISEKEDKRSDRPFAFIFNG